MSCRLFPLSALHKSLAAFKRPAKSDMILKKKHMFNSMPAVRIFEEWMQVALMGEKS